MISRIFILGLPLIFIFQISFASENDENVKIVVDAAREMEYTLPENRSYFLIKKETIASPVGMIFGYVDNAAACAQLAETLSASSQVGTFECSPIY